MKEKRVNFVTHHTEERKILGRDDEKKVIFFIHHRKGETVRFGLLSIWLIYESN